MKTDIKNDPDYQNLVNLLSVHSEASTRQLALNADFNHQFLEVVDEHKGEYAANQNAISEAEGAIKVIVARHPEWFEKAKTIKTPYGSVKSVSTTSIDVPSEEATIRLIRAAGRSDEFIRTVEELDKEALEKLDDKQLAKFGLTRKSAESVTIKPLAVDLGAAVNQAEKQAKAA